MEAFKLGKPENFTDEMRKKGRAAHHEKAIENENNRRAYSFIQVLRKQKVTYRSITQKLNESGFKTSKGNSFFGNSIIRLEKMFEKA